MLVRRWLEEKEARKARDDENLKAWQDWARGLSYDLKALLVYLSEHESLELQQDCQSVRWKVLPLGDTVSVEEIGLGVTRLSLSESGVVALPFVRDVLDNVMPNQPCWWRYGEPSTFEDLIDIEGLGL